MIILLPSNANEITIENTAPIVVIAFKQPNGKKHIFMILRLNLI